MEQRKERVWAEWAEYVIYIYKTIGKINLKVGKQKRKHKD